MRDRKPFKKKKKTHTLISDHFNKKDFMCNCDHCKGSLKISLTVIGILEYIRSHFKNRVNIIKAYVCADKIEEKSSFKKSYHNRGKAVDITVSNVSNQELFLFAETIDSVNGIGYYPKENFVHIDIRDQQHAQTWVFIDDQYKELTETERTKYGLVK